MSGTHVAHGRKIAVIGLGYVGLPVAVAFGRSGATVIGYDIACERVRELQSGADRTLEVAQAELRHAGMRFTADPTDLATADFFIVTVPTPIDAARRPDLTAVLKASLTVGKAMRKGAVVVYESTVYPGATEEECIPVLEQASGLKAGRDFTVGYSPERINPGDAKHRFETITKVVAGQDARTLDLIAAVYASVIGAGIHKVPSIKVAEAAKVIENAQRDLNIALMNEFSAICHLLGIDTGDVLAAAQTKWNFLPFTPGLVGGHCIGVDPYYLTHCAQKVGYHPEVILAGRRLNDGVGQRVARECVRRLMRNRSSSALVTILGVTFKENVPDVRNSKVIDIVHELEAFGVSVQMHDPLASAEHVRAEYGIDLLTRDAMKPADALVLAVPHRDYVEQGWNCVVPLLKDRRGLVMDVKGRLDRAKKPDGVELWRL
jgi:UDP-N-acetyl-D-galactosamine dehydrogenase